MKPGPANLPSEGFLLPDHEALFAKEAHLAAPLPGLTHPDTSVGGMIHFLSGNRECSGSYTTWAFSLCEPR